MKLGQLLNFVKDFQKKRFQTPFSQPIVLALFALTIGTSGMAYYFYGKYSAVTSSPESVAQGELESLLAEVSKLIVLPIDEVPTIATVTDPERLRGEAFFSKAKKGDKVLIYTNAKKAILYDPENKRIVEVVPLNIGDTQQ